MSMRDYPVNDYGMLITEEMLRTIASNVFDDYTEEEYENDTWSFIDYMYDRSIIEYISEFTGGAICIKDDGTDGYEIIKTYSDDEIFYIPASRISTLFNAAYNGIGEMIEEFKNNVGKYLPDDFNYRPYICHIVGTYFG